MDDIRANAACSICGKGFTPEQWDNRYTDPLDGLSDCHEHCFDDNANDCAFMIGHYPPDWRIPAHNNPEKTINVGCLQICAWHVKNGYQYPCPFTRKGAREQCDDYAGSGVVKKSKGESVELMKVE
jgi:hypothetical protein